jgi:biotin carboxyl carrier protein/GAF domain-containing protein
MQADFQAMHFKPFLEALDTVRSFQGEVTDFWEQLAQALYTFPECKSVRLLARSDAEWKILAAHPHGRGSAHKLTREDFDLMCAEAAAETYSERALRGAESGHLLLVRLDTSASQLALYAELLLPAAPTVSPEVLRSLLRGVTTLPSEYERSVREQHLQSQLDAVSCALETVATINATRQFIPAAMALVNEVARRFKASRVSLGWVDGYYAKVIAMNGTDRIERKVEVIQRLEAAMEECRDQEEELLYPRADQSDLVSRGHEAYAQESHVAALLSVPLRFEGAVCAVLTLEREQGQFTLDEAQGLRVIADQVAPVLYDLQQDSRWFGRRWADAGRALFANALGPRHTWLKVGALLGAAFLAFALCVPYGYRTKANFIVEPDRLALLPVPFNGFIESVAHRPGDLVAQGEVLFAMDDGELRVERARAEADVRRYTAEAELAEARNERAEYRVARELAGQAEARLQLANYRYNRAQVKAPFTGIVVEGDLRERIGAPVDQGEVLMKFSQLDGLFLEIELEERDIDLLDGSQRGQVAFASRPEVKFPIEIERIEPSAQAGQGKNFFVIRAHLEGTEADWLRPGMTGVARLDAGKRTLAWRATHRLVDFLRMFFWV